MENGTKFTVNPPNPKLPQIVVLLLPQWLLAIMVKIVTVKFHCFNLQLLWRRVVFHRCNVST